MRKVFAFIFIFILLASNISAQDQTQQQSGNDYSGDPAKWDYSNVDWTQVTDDKWDEIPADKIASIPPDKIKVDKLTPSQTQGLTSTQLEYGDNLARIGNLANANPLAVKQALADKYNKVDVTIGTGFLVDFNGLANNNGLSIDLKKYGATDKIEAISDGWIINGVKYTGKGNFNIDVSRDGEFVIDGNVPDTVSIDGKSTGTSNLGGKSLNIEILSGKVDVSRLSIRADDAIITGIDSQGNQFGLTGRGEINFNEGGDLARVNIEAYEGKQSRLVYKGTEVQTAGHDVSIFTTQADFNSGKGNKALILDDAIATTGILRLSRGDLTVSSKSDSASMSFKEFEHGVSLTSSKGKITIEDGASTFTGLQDNTVMKKETREGTDGKFADFYSIDGSNGDMAYVDKKIKIGAGRALTDIELRTTVAKRNNQVVTYLDASQIQIMSQIFSDPNTVGLIERSMFIESGNSYFGINEFGVGRFESADGKSSSTVFPVKKGKSLVGNQIIALTSTESEQLRKITSFNPDDIRSVDVNALKANPSLRAYVERNMQLDVDRLDNFIKNPDSAESKAYFLHLASSSKQFQDGLKELTDAQKLTDSKLKLAATVSAQKKLLQSQIELNTANGRSSDNLASYQRQIEIYDRFASIGATTPAQQIIELKKLKEDPKYKDSASTLLSQIYVQSAVTTLQGNTENKYSSALINIKLAQQSDPTNPLYEQVRKDYDVALLKTIRTGVGTSREQQLTEIESKPHASGFFGRISNFITTGAGSSALEIAYGDYLSDYTTEEEKTLAQQQAGISIIESLRGKGLSWEQIQEAGQDPIRLANTLGLKDINSQDADVRHQASVLAASLQGNVREALLNPDVRRVANPRGETFDFEAGKGYTDTSQYINTFSGHGITGEIAGNILDSTTSVLGAAIASGPGVILTTRPFAFGLTTTSVAARLGSQTAIGAALGAASAVRIGGTIGQAGDALLAPVYAAGRTVATTAADFRSAIGLGGTLNPVIAGTTKHVTDARAELLAAQQEVKVYEAVGDTQKFEEATTKANLAAQKLTAAIENENEARLSTRLFNLFEEGSSGNAGANIERAATSTYDDIYSVTNGKQVIVNGKPYTPVRATANGVVMDGVDDAVVVRSGDEIEGVITQVSDNPPRFVPDKDTMEYLGSVDREAVLLDQKATVASIVDDTKVQFNPLREQEVDDVSRFGVAETTTDMEIVQARAVENQAEALRDVADTIISGDPSAAGREIRIARRTIDDLTQTATENKVALALQNTKPGDKVSVISLSGKNVKEANKLGSETGNDFIRAFRDGTEELVPRGKEVTIGVSQKNVILTGDHVERDIALMADNGAESAEIWRAEQGISSISNVEARYGIAEIPSDVANIRDGTAIARGRAEIAARLAEDENIVDITRLSPDEIKALGGKDKLEFTNKLIEQKQTFLQSRGLSRFGHTYDKTTEEFINTLGDEQVILFDTVPQGTEPDLVRLRADANKASSDMVELQAEFRAGSLTAEEFKTKYHELVDPVVDELEAVNNYHDKFNKFNGVNDNVFGRRKWFSDAEKTVLQGDYVIAGDVNNMGIMNRRLLSQELTGLKGTTVDERILATSSMSRNAADQEIVKTINGIDNELERYRIASGLDETQRASVGVVAGDELLTKIPRKLGDYIKSASGREPSEVIRSYIEQNTQLRMSFGQAQHISGESIVGTVKRSDDALNWAKNTKIVGEQKNAAAVIDANGQIRTITPGREGTTLGNARGTMGGEYADEIIPRVSTGFEALSVENVPVTVAP